MAELEAKLQIEELKQFREPELYCEATNQEGGGMAKERERIWRVKVRRIVRDWLLCRGLPESALVDFEIRGGNAKAILRENPPEFSKPEPAMPQGVTATAENT